MSRLKPEEIADIGSNIAAYDAKFASLTGETMLNAAKIDFPFSADLKGVTAAVIPVTSGLGIIAGFAESVRAILNHVGCNAFVAEKSDVAGLGIAHRKGADVVFMADDREYAAISLNSRAASYNSDVTGIAFARALNLAAGGVCGGEVLVLGLGPVGLSAARHLLSLGARVNVFDNNPSVLSAAIAAEPKLRAFPDWRERGLMYILDATPKPDILTERDIAKGAVLSLPGIPLGANARVIEKCGAAIANPLELGTIAMLACVLYLTER
ncbi:MAG: 3-methylornithyl-N6-L-lysine dehydrogenase PylD [Oscillospiraceae bacterium]|jgi:pyrrolysine biosynthesis protein PylD|nr:3-methylornithyl-N6-L-lysine dehydrogenase PylD [Oscillospiraceae bacterium]